MIPNQLFPHLVRYLIWCVPLLATCLAWQLGGPLTLDVAASHGRDVVRGFYAPESGSHGSFRWSQPDAALTLPARPSPVALLLRGAVAPDGTRLSLSIGSRMSVDLPPADALVSRTYLVLLPADAATGGVVRIALIATPPERPVERRPLGMALSAAELRLLGDGLHLPPLPLLAALTLLPPLLAVCLEVAGMRPSAARLISIAAVAGAGLLALARPLAAVPLLLDLTASLGSSPVQRWLAAQLIVAVAALSVTALLFRHLPLRGLLFARAVGLVLLGWLSWWLSVAVRLPFGLASLCLSLLLLATAGSWGLRRSGLRDLAALLRGRWRVLVAGETFFTAMFLFGLWLRWNGAVGPAISGTEKPMDLALLQGAMRDQQFPPVDVWFAGEPVNYYYLGYVQLATIATLAGVTPGEAFNLGMATLFSLTATMVAAVVATLVALHRQTRNKGRTIRDEWLARDGRVRDGRASDERRSIQADGRARVNWSPMAGEQWQLAAAALLGVTLVLLCGNQLGALQLLLGGSQVRVLDGGQLAEALWQRLRGAETIVLSRPTPPAPDFGTLTGWTPLVEREFDWYGPSRIVLDDIALGGGAIERRQAITEFPFFSFYLGDLHAHLLALPHGLLILALALAAIARPTLPVYVQTPRGWLELALTGMILGSLYAVNAWDAPGWWLLFFGALALLYWRIADEERRTSSGGRGATNGGRGAMDEERTFSESMEPRTGLVVFRMWSLVARLWSFVRDPWSLVGGRWLPHFVQSALALGAVMLMAVGPFLATYRSPFGVTAGPRPWAGLPLLDALGQVLGPAPAHTRLHVFVVMFGLLLLPLLALGLASEARRRATIGQRMPIGVRSLLGVSALTLAVGQLVGFPLLALMPLALWFALLACRHAANPALSLALWGAAVAALLVLAADTVYVRDQLEGFMSRYITVFKLYFQAWVIWGTLAAYALWGVLSRHQEHGAHSGETQLASAAADAPSTSRLPLRLINRVGHYRNIALSAIWLALLAGALVYPIETVRRGEPWGQPGRDVDGLAFIARRAPDEAAAIDWLSANVGVEQTVLTAWCECAPDEVGRVAAASGVPTLLGRSEGHQRLWRAGWAPWLSEIAARERDIAHIYLTEDAAEALRLLTQYDVDYVYVGALESQVHRGPGLAKFDQLLQPAFAQGEVRIYRVPR